MGRYLLVNVLAALDCKDRKPAEDLADALKPHLHRPLIQQLVH